VNEERLTTPFFCPNSCTISVGERKIAGRRELTAPRAWLMQLRCFFGKMRLDSITRGEIEKFEVWLSHLPTRSVIEESEDGGELVLTRHGKGGRRSVEAVNRPVELLRTMLNHAIDEKMLRPDQSPFADRKTRSQIERSREKKREPIPGFGEEMVLLETYVLLFVRNRNLAKAIPTQPSPRAETSKSLFPSSRLQHL
jgi:hypothetical protein